MVYCMDRTVSLQVDTDDITANEGSDYNGVSRMLVFGPDSPTVARVTIAIISDGQLERNETFSVMLRASERDNYVVIGRDQAQITIIDESRVVIALEAMTSVIREGEESAKFNIRVVSGVLGVPVELVYFTYNINATGGVDYSPKENFPVLISDNNRSIEGFVAVIDDDIFEGEVNERFGVYLSLVSGDYDGRVSIRTSTIEIQIEDNDPRIDVVTESECSSPPFTTSPTPHAVSCPTCPACPIIDPIDGCEFGDLRLVDGTNALEGRVEVCNNRSVWGTVCNDFFSLNDAKVICRQLGHSGVGAVSFPNSPFGRGLGPILLDNLICSGNELRLVDCPHNGVGIHNCDHSEDAGVRCMPV